MENKNIPVEEAYRTLMIIWFGLFMSQLMFFVLVFFAKPELFSLDLSRPALGGNPPIILIFFLLALSNLVLSLFLGKMFIDRAIEEQKVPLVQTAMIIGCALCESISLLGIFLAFILSYQYFFIWILLGIFGMTLHFPKRAHIQAAGFKKPN
ncbi:MAG: hypothetical protein R2747_24740 [Pyrinomonadaceae bacterium]